MSSDPFSATGPWLQSLDTDLQMGEQESVLNIKNQGLTTCSKLKPLTPSDRKIFAKQSFMPLNSLELLCPTSKANLVLANSNG
uniref:Uncharacterized protein n=1 Tax=Romanomermis culicivorax TaxID=13658 RepID=A0A915JAA6_ROMCU